MRTTRNKTTMLLLFALPLAFTSFAQKEYNYQHSDYGIYYNQAAEKIDPDAGIEQVTKVITTHKGKVKASYICYDENGKIASRAYKNKKGEWILRDSIVYDPLLPDNILSRTRYRRNGKLHWTSNSKWNEHGSKTLFVYTDGSGKIKRKSVWEYNEDGKIQRSCRYQKGGEDTAFTWMYVYDKEGNKLQSQLYNRHGKLKHKWDFSCHEEGALLEKEKDKTQVCQWSKEDGNRLIRTYQKFDEKGRIRKYVSYYSLDDTTILEHKTFNSKDELIYHTKYTDGKQTSWERLRKGKSISIFETTYDGEKQTSWKRIRKGKEKWCQKYHFEEDLLVREEYSSNGKHRFRIDYTYNSAGLKKEARQYDKKNKQRSTIVYSYKLKQSKSV